MFVPNAGDDRVVVYSCACCRDVTEHLVVGGLSVCGRGPCKQNENCDPDQSTENLKLNTIKYVEETQRFNF